VKKGKLRFLLIIISVCIVVSIIILLWVKVDNLKATEQSLEFLSQEEFDELAEQGKIAAVRCSEDQAVMSVYKVTDEMRDMSVLERAAKVSWHMPKYCALYPGIDILRQTCMRCDIYIQYVNKKQSVFVELLLLLPLMLIYIVLFKRLNAGGIAGTCTPQKSSIMFSDVIGHDEILEDIKFIVELIKDPKRGEIVGAKAPKGLLLTGVPGTGKTLIAKAIAGEAGVPFLYADASSFMEMYVGVGAKRIREVFKAAERKAPCILFIDEIYAIGCARGAYRDHGESAQTLNELLQQMDGFVARRGVFVIAATNQPDKLDAALTRPGRFDRRIDIRPPEDWQVRSRMFEYFFNEMKIDESVDIDNLAKQTAGFTGADIAVVCNEAGIVAAARGMDVINNDCVEEAIDKKIFNGNHSKRQVIKKDREVAAYHEAGHAIISYLCGEEISRVTIAAQTSGVGGAVVNADGGSLLKTRQNYINKIMICYGGRASEEIKFGQVTVGAANDIMQATSLLAEYVGNMGFDEEYGLLSRNVLSDKYNEDSKHIIDIMHSKSIELYKAAYDQLKENYDLVEKLAQELLGKENLTGAEISDLLGCQTEGVQSFLIQQIKYL